MNAPRIVLATGNAHKLEEAAAILAAYGIEVCPPGRFGGMPEVEEDGDTFLANACKKAIACSQATGVPALADDSGLEVAALDGRPGVISARYAGPHGDHAANIRKLLAELDDNKARDARFVCVLALADGNRIVASAEGEVRGTIASAPRGHGGFGYDPVFVPNGYERTFAELPAEVKNRLSHRAEALRNAVRQGVFKPLGNR